MKGCRRVDSAMSSAGQSQWIGCPIKTGLRQGSSDAGFKLLLTNGNFRHEHATSLIWRCFDDDCKQFHHPHAHRRLMGISFPSHCAIRGKD